MLKVRRASFFVTQKDLVAAEADYPPPSGKSNSDGLPAPSSSGSLAMLLAMRLASSKVSILAVSASASVSRP